MTVADVEIFKAWGSRLDASPLKYLKNLKEVWASISHLPVFWMLFLFIIIYGFLLFAFNKIATQGLQKILLSKGNIFCTLLLILLAGINIIPLRGGLQLAPINQSSVYFSQNNFSNLAAINGPWNFMYSLDNDTESGVNPFNYISSREAVLIKDSLYKANGNVEKIIDLYKTPAPNIIFIVWESFTEKVTALQKNGVSITPGFNALKKEGVYFSNIYATGDRTDKGIVAVLSGYPAQPITSILKIPGKAGKLPIVSAELSKKGYHNLFYYGGEPEFANMKAYLMQGVYNKFITEDDFEKKDQNSKWGAHDGVVSKKLSDDLKTIPHPFFCNWLTLSSHEPFETPVPTVIRGKGFESLFLNSLHYTDSIVHEFIQNCKKQSWWNNTIVVIVADHGHSLPSTGKKIDDFKIPMLFLGGALTKTGIEINKFGSQTDLPATLFGLMNYPTKSFNWSKNLLDSSIHQWAYFSFNNGFGYVEPGKYLIFDNVGKMIIEKQGNISGQDIKKGKAIQQLSFQDYLDK